jgi:hypothetical protein
MNINMNWAFDNVLFNVRPISDGYHIFTPAMMANTAPIDRT